LRESKARKVSELKLTQDRANELLAIIALYRALGGRADPVN
jgi:hypothetical protein